MKRITTLFTLTLIGMMMTLSAQNQKIINHDLIGLWQQEQTISEANGKSRVVHLPVWKIISSDGTFYTFLIASRDGRSMKMNEGTFTLESDGIVTEHVRRSLTAPQLNGCDNVIRYRFDGKDLVEVVYRLPEAVRDAKETWRRVSMELPK